MSRLRLLPYVLLLLVLLPTAVLAGGNEPVADDNSGGLDWRVPIDVPPGPAGSTPSLALLYSSAAAGGGAGWGWDLPYSSVRIDLSRGVPASWLPAAADGGCDPEAMQGVVWVDGMETVPWEEDPVYGGPGRCIFRTRPDTFAAIVPIFEDASCSPGKAASVADQPTGWAVVRQDGTTWWYGDSDPCETLYRRIAEPGAGFDGGPPLVVEWMLHHVEDRDDNVVTFHPDWPDRPHWAELVESDPEDTAGCDGCLRHVTWGRRVAHDPDSPGDFAWDPTPDADPASSFSFPTYSGGGLSGVFQDFLDAPALYWPQEDDHYYFVQVDWEDRPDVRVSWATGGERVADRRIRQILVGANGRVGRNGGRSELDTSVGPQAIRTYRLHYDAGTTGRSRLVRVHEVPSQYDPMGQYPGVPVDGSAPFEPTAVDPAVAEHTPNPWEFVYSDNETLEPVWGDGVAWFGASAAPVEMSFDGGDPPWQGSDWAEGGFPTVTRLDLSGDRLADLVQDSPTLPHFPVMEANLAETLLPYSDALPNEDDNGGSIDLDADVRMWVRWNQGDSFSEPLPGPVDPFALQEVADWMMLDAVGGDLPHESGGAFTEPGEACEHWWTGLPSATALGPLPVSTAMTLPQAAWCEYRSCAPYCELGTSVSGLNPHSAATSGPGLPQDWLALETEKESIVDPEGVHSKDDLVLWRKYAVTRGSSGNASATALAAAAGEPGFDPLLMGLEPETRVRWVDGYARRSFQTRVASENVEALRAEQSYGGTIPLEVLWALPVREGSVKDTRDLNGDGFPDLLLGGAGQFYNDVTGDQAVLSVEPDVPKDLVASTAHMPWMASLFDPESGEFLPMEPWWFDREHEALMGPPDPYLPSDVNDPRLFEADHGLEFLELWESSSSMAPALVSSGASASVGPSGPAAGGSISMGPVSLSLSFTAGGVAPSVGVGPLSFSPGTMSLGPMQYDHATGDWSGAGAGFVIQKVITKALETMEIPYTAGFFPDSGGAVACMPAVGCDSVSPKQQVRWARHLLRDMDGDGRPDLVIAHQPHWADDPQYADLDWLVLLNEGDGFGDPRPWPGVHTEYVEAHVTDGYLNEDGVVPPPQLTMRRGHQVAGLADMNGDGLPDFVYSSMTALPEEPHEVPFDYVDGPAWEESRLVSEVGYSWDLGHTSLLVKLNTGQGFDPDPVDWFAGDVPEQAVHVAGHYPAISSTRSHAQQSALYNDSWGIGIGGLRDWNGDGLVDYWAMSSGDFEELEDVWGEDRHAVIFLNDGRRFVTDHPVSDSDRYGRLELLGPDAMSEQQFIPSLWAPILGAGPPQVALDVNKVFHQPGGSVVQTGVDDVDGDGRLDWFQAVGFENGTPSLQLYPLQDEVPDLLVQVWEPGGATHEMQWAPARDFLDLPADPNPRLLVDGTPLTDGAADAFPASSQLLVGLRTLDGLGSLGGQPLKTGLEYADPGYLHAFPLRRATGFARVRETLDGTITEQQWATDRHRAGLVEVSLVSDDVGQTWSTTKTGWIHAPFDGNYPATGQPIGLNWHFAPADVLDRRYEHGPGGSGPLESRSLTSFEPRNGLAVCVQVDPDGDGYVDRVEWTDWDEAQIEDGRQDAAEETGLIALPQDAYGFLTEEDCKRAPWSVHQLRHTSFERFASGRVETASVYDATGLTPAPLIEAFGYTPDGQQVRHTDPAGADRWTLYDPIVGVHPIESHQPPNLALGVAHVTRVGVCGLGELCPPAAHGSPAEVVDEAGLHTWTSYDVQGRPVAIEDSSSSLAIDPDNPGPTTVSHQRPVRRVPVDELPEGVGAEGLPAVVTTTTTTGTPPLDLWGAPVGTPEPTDSGFVTSVTFVDGLGRPVMNRESWTDETGTPGWRVTGVTRRDGRSRPTDVVWPCFSAADLLDGSAFIASFDPLASDLGSCVLPPPRQSFAYDPIDRAVTEVRPDGARVDAEFSVAGDEAVIRTTLKDPTWGLLSDVEERSSPFALRTLRRGAKTWTHVSGGPWLGGPPVPDTDVLKTVERRDAVGRRISVERTGVDPVDFTTFGWDGLDRMVSYFDPDQGDWTFDYDGAGRLQSRTLWKGAGPELETWWSYDSLSRPVLEEHFRAAGGGGLQLSEWVERSWDEDLAHFAPDVQPVAGGHVGRTTSTAHGYVDSHTGTPVTDVVEGWRYDRRGNVVDRFIDLSGEPELAGASFPTNLSAQYAWSNAGQRTRTWMPLDRERVSVELDSLGRAVGLVGESLSGDVREVLLDQDFDVLGRSRLLGFGNGTVQELAYATGIHSDQALVSAQVTGPDGSILLGREFTWDAAGNLRGWDDAATAHFGAERFSCDYDGIGSLLGCSLDGGEEEVSYRYDPLGNLIFEQVSLPGGNTRTAGQYYRAGGGLRPAPSPGYTSPLNSPVARVDVAPGAEPASSLLYDPRGHLLLQMIQGGQQSWNGTVDASEIGLLDSNTGLWQPVDAWRQFDWTAAGRLHEVRVGIAGGAPEQTGRLWWSSGGAQVASRSRPHSSETGEEVTVLRFDGLLEVTARALSGPDATTYYRLGSRLIAQRDHAPDLSTQDPDDLLFDRIRYVAGDHLGSATVITDEGDLSVGALPEVVHAVRYEPYGRVRQEAGTDAHRPDYAESGVEELFNGKPRMRATFGLQGTEQGLEGYDYGARLYLPQYSRWASADSITPDQVWEANPFAYVRNNPLKYVDPDGHAACWKQEEVQYGDACKEKLSLAGEHGRSVVYAAGIAFLAVSGQIIVEILPTGRAKQAKRMVEMGMESRKADRLARAFVAAKRRPGLVRRLWQKARGKDGPGEWAWKARSDRGMDYQALRAGTPVRQRADKKLEILEYLVGGKNGIYFDDFAEGVLYDYKDYAHLMEKGTSHFKELCFLQGRIAKEARDQLRVAGDVPVVWSVPTRKQQRAFQKVLRDEGVDGISVVVD